MIPEGQAGYYGMQALWRSNKAVKLNFNTNNANLNTWSCTAMTVKRTDSANRPSVTAAPTVVSLSNSNGFNYSDPNCANEISSVTILGLTSTAIFYTSYAVAGAATTTASTAGITSAVQNTTVVLDPYTWMGGGGDTNWTNAANWFGGTAPDITHSAHFDSNCVSNCSPTTNNAFIQLNGLNMHRGYAGTITQGAGNPLFVANDKSAFIMTSGTFIGGNSDITNYGSFYLQGGTFTSTSAVMSARYDFIFSGTSVFNHNNGTIKIISGSDPSAMNTNAQNLYNLTFQRSNIWVNLIGTTTVLQDLALNSSGAFGLFGGALVVKGNITDTGTGGSPSQTTILTINGTTPQTITGSSSSNLTAITINSTSTVSLVGTLNIVGRFNRVGGTIAAGTSLVKFTGNSDTVNLGGAVNFYDVEFSTSNLPIIISGTMNVLHDLTQSGINNGTLQGLGTINANHDVTFSGFGGYNSNTALLKMVGVTAQKLTGSLGSVVPSIEINSPGGVSLFGTIDIGQDWIQTAGTVTAGTSLVRFLDPNFLTTGSTVFNNVDFVRGGNVPVITGTIFVNGNLNYGCKSIYCRTSGGTIAVKGNVTAVDYGFPAYLGPNNTVIRLEGTSPQTLTGVATAMLPAIEIASPGGVALAGTIDVASTWKYTSGAVTAGSSTLRFLGFSAGSVDSGSMNFNNVNFMQASGPYTITGTMNITGNLDINTSGTGAINGGTIAVGGNLTETSQVAGGTVGFDFNGSGAQTVQANAGRMPTGNYSVNKSGGTLTLLQNLGLPGPSQSFTINSGTVRLNGNGLIVGAGPQGVFTVNGTSSVLQCNGGCGAGTACNQGSGKLSCLSLSTLAGGVITP